ncbi:hypothetical protein C8R43DRAFT_1034406 [Mycena crocata]|nr:hypothetical protein C8R43DRAFT_1034373 [Mycena crocata]KAJ7120418.1 hypothetical protein C8R43DRAFT_1034406 [Mycena crocata]
MVTVTGGDRDVWRCWHHLPKHPNRLVSPRLCRPCPVSPPSQHRPPLAAPRRPLSLRPGEHGSGARYAPLSHLRPSSLAYIPTQDLALIRTRTRRRTLHTVDIHCLPPFRHAHTRWKSPAIPHESPRHHKRVKYDTNARRHQPRQPARTRPARSLHLRPPVTTHSHSGRRGTRLSRADGW